MAGEWTTFRLGDVCTKIGSGATPRGGNSVYLDQGEFALIRSQNVYNDGFHHDGLVYLTQMHAEQLANVEVERHDVLLNITGDSVARACQVDPEVLPARVNQHVAIIRPYPKQLWPRYLRFFLVSPTMQAHMLQLAGAGATRNALTKGMIESFDIPAPRDVNDQQAIACILGALDDKIELNRGMNRTLEEMARAIFKSWFVDFDPVRAKAAVRREHPKWTDEQVGRAACPNLKPEIAALFPDAFEDSELGEIPKGWSYVTLGEIAEVNWGDTSVTKKSYVDHGFLAFSAKGPDGFLSYYDYDRTGIVVSAIGANSGYTWLARGKWSCIKNTIRFWATNSSVSTEYLFLATHGDNIWPVRGSAQPFISQTDARNIAVLFPSSGEAKVFGGLVEPFLAKIETNEIESRVLASIRDTLLPKLISGELRVPDAERIAGRCA